jgi:hypothetical protein
MTTEQYLLGMWRILNFVLARPLAILASCLAIWRSTSNNAMPICSESLCLRLVSSFDRSRDSLLTCASQPVENEFGPAMNTGDVIGCGYIKNDGSIFFTRNGALLGTAFVGVQGRLVPLVRMLGPGAQLRANFGQEPFKFKVRSLRDIDDAGKAKLRKENEEKRARERAEAAAKETAKREQAELLHGFVGFPIDFCMVALEHTGGNVEAAAGWALENFERVTTLFFPLLACLLTAVPVQRPSSG